MRNKLIYIPFLSLAILTVGIGSVFAQRSVMRPERHPMIERAIGALRAAQDDLGDASHDFCGHRAEAAEATNNALRQLQLALASDRASVERIDTTPVAVAFENASFTDTDLQVRNERHPKIRQAINALQRARGDLQNAAHDFHGHRVEALESVDRALNQLRLAIACDRR